MDAHAFKQMSSKQKKKERTSQRKRNDSSNTKNLIFLDVVLDGMGDKRDEFDTSYSIQIAKEKE